eukprot:1467429-Rhodomonas_salina.1
MVLRKQQPLATQEVDYSHVSELPGAEHEGQQTSLEGCESAGHRSKTGEGMHLPTHHEGVDKQADLEEKGSVYPQSHYDHRVHDGHQHVLNNAIENRQHCHLFLSPNLVTPQLSVHDAVMRHVLDVLLHLHQRGKHVVDLDQEKGPSNHQHCDVPRRNVVQLAHLHHRNSRHDVRDHVSDAHRYPDHHVDELEHELEQELCLFGVLPDKVDQPCNGGEAHQRPDNQVDQGSGVFPFAVCDH